MDDLFLTNALKKRQFNFKDLIAVYNRKHLLQRSSLEV